MAPSLLVVLRLAVVILSAVEINLKGVNSLKQREEDKASFQIPRVVLGFAG